MSEKTDRKEKVMNCLEEYLLYLRKSRADNPDESVEEVLQKHYNILQDFCEREFGYRIPEENIFREVVSGESIDERIEIKKVLNKIESKAIKGVIVIEPQRLSRGDLTDCGKLIDTFRFSNTLVITPTMTYDMNNKMERRFFQDELMRGRDYLEYTKDILMRGRIAACKRGCFIQSTAPYGYDKVKIGKDYVLQPNEYADNVRLIYSMYASGSTTIDIAKELKRLNIKSPTGQDEWRKETISKILKNHHYIGKVTFQKRKESIHIIDGEKVKRRLFQDDFIMAEGKHQAIIDEETFNICQEIFSSHPPVKADREMRNMFAGLLHCSKCGKAIQFKKMSKAKYRKTLYYYVCNTVGCSKSIDFDDFNRTVIQALKQAEMPNLMAKYKNGDGDSIEIQKRKLKSLENEMAQLKAQEEKQYELLEMGKYTIEIFDARNKVVRDKILECEKSITETKKTLPNAIDYKEKIATLQEAIDSMENPDIPVKVKNKLLKSIIERIDITSNYTKKYGEYDYSIDITLRL